jgi:hypothetical protein
MTSRCALCGSDEVVKVTPFFHASHSVSLRLDLGSTGEDAIEGNVNDATLCLGCGHVAMYVEDLPELKAAYEAHRQR